LAPGCDRRVDRIELHGLHFGRWRAKMNTRSPANASTRSPAPRVAEDRRCRRSDGLALIPAADKARGLTPAGGELPDEPRTNFTGCADN